MVVSIVGFLIICATIYFKGFISDIKESKYRFMFRRINQCICFFIPGIFTSLQLVDSYWNLWVLLLGLIVPVFYWWRNKKSLVFLLSEETLPIYDNTPIYIYIINIITLTVMPVGEEFFFRGVVLVEAKEINIFFGIFINSVLFCLVHYIQRRGVTTRKETLNQFLFSVFFSILDILGNGLVYSIVSHLLYNLPFLVRMVKIAKNAKMESVE